MQIVQPHSGQRAHQPVGDGGQLLVRVGDQFNKGGSGGKQRPDHYARQHHRQIRAHPAQPPDQIRQSHRRKAEEERACRDDGVARAEQNRQRRTEARAGRRAQQIGRHHGVAEHGLIRRARGRERRADERGGQNARQADLDDDGGLLRRPCGREAQMPARNARQRPVRQQPRGL